MRINLNIPDELVKTIDKKAKSLNLNRTAYIVMTLSKNIQQENLMDSLPEFMQTMKSAVELEKAKTDSAIIGVGNGGEV